LTVGNGMDDFDHDPKAPKTAAELRQLAIEVLGHLVRPAGRHIYAQLTGRPLASVPVDDGTPRSAVLEAVKARNENARFVLRSALEVDISKMEAAVESDRVNREVVFVKESDLESVLERRLNADRPS
jgi:hypothetical protein